MQVLIVHHEAEIGQVLLGMVREYTAHPAKFVASNDTASVNANIRHPAILPVCEAGEHEGTYFYAREFVIGRTAYEIRRVA